MTDTKPRDDLRRSLRVVKVLFGVFAVAMVLLIAGLYLDARERNDFIDEVHRVGEQNCEGLQANREVLRTVVAGAYSEGNRDLTQVPGFADLPESVQGFLANLSAAPNNSTEQRDRLLALIPDFVCR